MVYRHIKKKNKKQKNNFNSEQNQSTFGFTLIEMVFVIAIITLLAGLIFSVIARSKAKALQTTCASNMRQLGMAILMYAQDYSNVLPAYENAYPGNSCSIDLPISGNNLYNTRVSSDTVCSPSNLHYALMSYIQDSQVWFCPHDPFAGHRTTQWLIDHQYSSYYFCFTGQIGSLFTIMKDDGSQWQISTGKIFQPFHSISKIPLIEDPNQYYIPSCSFPRDKLLYPPQAGGDHFKGVNFCYLDDHVKWIAPGCP